MKISSDICPICESSLESIKPSERDTYKINCKRCGNYEITEDALTKFQRSDLADKTLSVSYWIRKNQTNDSKTRIDINTMRSILIPFEQPKLQEQEDNLLRFISSIIGKPDGYTSIPISHLISLVGAVDEGNVMYVADSLKKQGLITHQGFQYTWYDGERHPIVDELKAQLTPVGWRRCEDLKTSNKVFIAFMAMEYKNSRLDEFYRVTLKPTLTEIGFDLRRLDEEPKAGIIDNHLRAEIKKAKLLIADLSTDNRGAYWEAGYAEGLGKEVIYICEKGKLKDIHFDTNHCQTVPFDWNDLDSFQKQLKATIRATFPSEAKIED